MGRLSRDHGSGETLNVGSRVALPDGEAGEANLGRGARVALGYDWVTRYRSSKYT
jgi:hypothetical protein